MIGVGRRGFVLGAAALSSVLATGCGGGSGGGGVSADDMALGSADAPVTIIEYASVTCPLCKEFHDTVWPELKTNYIDTGKARFIFREYPAHYPQVATAGFQVARCGGVNTEQYFQRIDVLFNEQERITPPGPLNLANAREALVNVGAAIGLSRDEVLECVRDEDGAARIRETMKVGEDSFGITGTPTFILNGRKVTDFNVYEYSAFARAIDDAIDAGAA